MPAKLTEIECPITKLKGGNVQYTMSNNQTYRSTLYCSFPIRVIRLNSCNRMSNNQTYRSTLNCSFPIRVIRLNSCNRMSNNQTYRYAL